MTAWLDTLFLTPPVSWGGTVAQYLGGLHRLYDGKRECPSTITQISMCRCWHACSIGDAVGTRRSATRLSSQPVRSPDGRRTCRCRRIRYGSAITRPACAALSAMESTCRSPISLLPRPVRLARCGRCQPRAKRERGIALSPVGDVAGDAWSIRAERDVGDCLRRVGTNGNRPAVRRCAPRC